MESSSNFLYKVRVDLPVKRESQNVILNYFSEIKYRKNISFRRCNTCFKRVKVKFNHFESLGRALVSKGGPDLKDSSGDEDDSDREEDES